MTNFRNDKLLIKNRFLISYFSIKIRSRLWYELMISFDFCFIFFSSVSKLILKIFIVLTENLFWNRFQNAMIDSKIKSFWNSKSAVLTFVSAHSAASSVRRKLMLFIYFFEEMTLFFLYELNSCFSFFESFRSWNDFFFWKAFTESKNWFWAIHDYWFLILNFSCIV